MWFLNVKIINLWINPCKISSRASSEIPQNVNKYRARYPVLPYLVPVPVMVMRPFN
jgi:hypothetical protein